VNSFDASIIHFSNRFAQRSWMFDHAVSIVAENAIFKGVLAMAVFWWLWFRRGNSRNEEDRRLLLFGLLGSCFGLIIARILAWSLPFRERPLHSPSLHFQVPFGVDITSLIGWSSFPSDHATLYFALAVTFFYVSRMIGVAGLAYAAIVICLPRIYLGIHYPTDILVGAFLGIGVGSLGGLKKLRNRVTNPLWQWMEKSQASFYAFLFVWSFSLAEQFDDLRALGSAALKMAKLTYHTVGAH
jgi:membrane-associated phospholipid phosphatase